MGRFSVVLVGLILCLGIVQDARAQGITIDTSDVRILFTPGKVLPQRTDTLTTSLDIGAPGASGWDLSKLHSSTLAMLVAKLPSATAYAADFPGTTHALADTAFTYSFASDAFGTILLKGSGVAYYTLANSTLTNAGFKGSGSAFIFGNPYPAQGAWLNAPAATEFVFPLQLGKNWNSSYTESIAGSVVALGSSIPFGPVYNVHQISFVVDGYGSLTLPDGISREALRIKKTDHYVNGSVAGTRVGYILRARDGASVAFTVSDTNAVRGTVGVSGIVWSEGQADFPVPIVLSQFNATQTDGGGVLISWATASETENFGFYLQRKHADDAAFTDIPGAFIAGHGTTIQPQTYAFTDMPGTSGAWWYRLKQVDLDGSFRFSDPVRVEAVTSVAGTVPAATFLAQNYPNPFNPSTTISFGVAERGAVILRVFNLLGQEVALLHRGEMDAGLHSITFDAHALPSGTYWYSLQAGAYHATKQLVLVR